MKDAGVTKAAGVSTHRSSAPRLCAPCAADRSRTDAPESPHGSGARRTQPVSEPQALGGKSRLCLLGLRHDLEPIPQSLLLGFLT